MSNLQVYHITNIPISCLQVKYWAKSTTASTDIIKGMVLKHFSIQLVTEGSGAFKIFDKNYKVKKGDILLMFPETPIDLIPVENFKCIFIDFLGSSSLSLVQRCGFSEQSCVIFNSSKDIQDIFSKSVNISKYTYSKDLLIIGYLFEIFALMADVTSINKKNNNINLYDHIEMALNFLERNYNNHNLNAKMICNELNLNREYFSRLFHKKTKLTFSEYLNNYRIAKACFLIETTDSNIQEIAYSCGFNSPYYFSRVFKELLNVAPSIYLKDKRNTLKKNN